MVHFDSHTGKLEPLVPWMEEVEKGAFLSLDWVFRNDLEKLSNLDHNAEEPPVGKVTHKVVDDSLEVLICQAFGFYPKEIQATWRRDGEVCQNETLHRNVAPNSDGTYYVQLSIEIDPKERDRFRCHLEHEGLQEPLVLAWKDKTGWWIPVGIMAASISGVWILFLIGCLWRRGRNNLCQEVTTCYDQAPSQSIRYSPGTIQKLRFKDYSCLQLT